MNQLMIFFAQDLIWLLPIFLLYKLSFEKNKKIIALILLAIIIGLLLGALTGLFYHHPRPFAIGQGRALIHHTANSSFPSHHVTVLASAGFMWIYLRRRLSGFFFLGLSFVVGFARVYCGVHYPTDILGGFLMGFLSSSVTYKIMGGALRERNLT